MLLGRRKAWLVETINEQSPDALERNFADEVLDVDAAITQRATLAIGLGDLRGKRDDSLKSILDFGVL
jgi:hypothetical protein